MLSDATRLRVGREDWLREVEDLLAERGIIVSYEAIRQWCRRFGSEYARRLNHRAEVSHEAVRQRERQMRRFKSARHAQRFLSVHGVVGNLFRVGRQKQIIVCGGLGIPFPGKADRGPISSDRKPVEIVGSSEMVSYSNDDTYS